MIAQNLRPSQWRFLWAIGSTDRCRIDACRMLETQATEGGGFHPEFVGGAITWPLPPLATGVAAKLFPFFPMLSKEKSPRKGHTMQPPKQFYLEFKWSAPLDPLMTTSNLFGGGK